MYIPLGTKGGGYEESGKLEKLLGGKRRERSPVYRRRFGVISCGAKAFS